MDRGLQARLHEAPASEGRALLESYIRAQVGEVVRLPAESIERKAPFRSLGIDSLMGLELRNRLESGLGTRLSAALIWTYPDVASLAAYLHGQIQPPPPLDGGGAPTEGEQEPAAAPGRLSDDELLAAAMDALTPQDHD
jgi:acyl carrier protein